MIKKIFLTCFHGNVVKEQNSASIICPLDFSHDLGWDQTKNESLISKLKHQLHEDLAQQTLDFRLQK